MDQRPIPPPSSFEVTFVKRVILKAPERLHRGFVDEWAGANELVVSGIARGCLGCIAPDDREGREIQFSADWLNNGWSDGHRVVASSADKPHVH